MYYDDDGGYWDDWEYDDNSSPTDGAFSTIEDAPPEGGGDLYWEDGQIFWADGTLADIDPAELLYWDDGSVTDGTGAIVYDPADPYYNQNDKPPRPPAAPVRPAAQKPAAGSGGGSGGGGSFGGGSSGGGSSSQPKPPTQTLTPGAGTGSSTTPGMQMGLSIAAIVLSTAALLK